MKRTFAWLGVLALLAALVFLTTCQPQLSPPPGGEEGDAEARATALLQAVIEAQATGDYRVVEEILARDDPQGELRRVLSEGKALARPVARSAEQPVKLPTLDTAEAYQTGDVLVCRGSGTLTSNLMDLVLVNGYAHAGILHLEVVAGGGTECILSADVDYLAEGQGEALNYESYLDWVAKNDVITLLRPKTPILDMGYWIGKVAENRDGRTVYAFLGYPGAPVGAFQPIPRSNNDYWYCSKVAARAYDLTSLAPVEDLDFHWEGTLAGAPRWWVVRQALLYKVYMIYLKLLNPWRSLRWCAARADEALQYVLAELVTPDELRASDKLGWQGSFTPAGFIDETQEASLLGWDTYQDY